MALTDQGHIFTWGRCTNGRQGFDAQATVQLPYQIHMPGGSERWHPICIAAGGRHSMCMTLPRQTVTDHDRRLTAQSESNSWLGRVSDMLIPQSAPVNISTHPKDLFMHPMAKCLFCALRAGLLSAMFWVLQQDLSFFLCRGSISGPPAVQLTRQLWHICRTVAVRWPDRFHRPEPCPRGRAAHGVHCARGPPGIHAGVHDHGWGPV